MPGFLLIIAMALGVTAPAFACAVPTSVAVENRSGRPLRAVFVESGAVHNQLPREGLLPGGTATITLPSCMGTYTVVAEYADGTRIRHTGLDAATIRGLTIR
ncbi:hypothetical protein [Plastoroseomonas arctica]|uniref:Uncharacterized protein n=1 Tax=Plastoroseomonas arctica TaxID=1509237 RepID=A0AAF1KJ87_9PROT|nr:hypothetical protein [Plastoroseomonas arctica]MBR0654690.1 hypothetical protein [Plastoroseomonas arctica]